MYKIFLTSYFLLYISAFSQPQEIQKIELATSKGYSDFSILKDAMGNNKVLILAGDEEKSNSSVFIYDNDYNLILTKLFNEMISPLSWSSSFNGTVLDSKYFLFSKKYIYQINIDNLRIDSLLLPSGKYDHLKYIRHLYVDSINTKKSLIFDYEEGVDIYSISPFNLIYSYKKEFRDKGYGSRPIIFKNNIIYLISKNELVSRNVDDGSENWRCNSGDMDISFLGIGIGSADNGIIEYLFNEENNFIIISTMNGEMLKVNASNGKIIQKTNNFTTKSKESFNGKINYILQTDLNNDSLKDFIGASSDKSIYAIDGHDFNILWSQELEDKCGDPISCFDINGDLFEDVFVFNGEHLYILDGNKGTIIYKVKIITQNSNKSISRTVLCDINNNGKLNVITFASSSELILFEMDNTTVQKGIILKQ